MTTLTKVLEACRKIGGRKEGYHFSLSPDGKKRTVECYGYNGYNKIIMGTVVVHGRSVTINDGHDNSLREDLEKYGIRTR